MGQDGDQWKKPDPSCGNGTPLGGPMEHATRGQKGARKRGRRVKTEHAAALRSKTEKVGEKETLKRTKKRRFTPSWL